MADMTANGGAGRRSGRTPRAEYRAYFALIFAVALVPATIGWAAAMLRSGRRPETGPVASAWKDALVITPQIFGG
ncbi:MAG: cytochrome PufQ [Rhodobacteraceae bacterium]|nr:cytochrome PufQ [Paracoccaceae bacterium]